MSKKKEEVKQEPVLDGVALSLIEKDNEWLVIKVPYSKDTLQAGEGSVVYTSEHMLDAEERLRILMATEIFL